MFRKVQRKTGSERLWAHDGDRWKPVGASANPGEQRRAGPTTRLPTRLLPPPAHPPAHPQGRPETRRVGVKKCKPLGEAGRSGGSRGLGDEGGTFCTRCSPHKSSSG